MARELNNSITDGVRRVSATTSTLAARVLTVCQTNNINDNAGLDAFLLSLTTVPQLRAVLLAISEGLVDIGPPGT